jgi:hypothetical protein
MIRLLSIALASAVVAASAVAQTGDDGWPERPIRLIVPFPAGSSTDSIARIVALHRKVLDPVVATGCIVPAMTINQDAWPCVTVLSSQPVQLAPPLQRFVA